MTTLKLQHAIDSDSVESLRRDFNGLMVAPQSVRVDCDRVMNLDPVGAALLWLLCQNVQQSLGTRVRLTGLNEELAQKLRSHPLQDFLTTGEEIFEDPFASPQQSTR